MSELPSTGPADALISLSPADARELVRLIGLLLSDHPTVEAQAILHSISAREETSVNERERLVSRARAIFSERRRRSEVLPTNLFNEHGWDMLLAVYITDFAGGRQTVGKLTSWIGAPATTAIRWIDYLENHRLVVRRQNENNRRIVFVDLTDKGREVLDRYLGTLPNSAGSL